MLMKEYRVCMPLSVEEYRMGQLYMIARHSHEQSQHGEGVQVVKNETCEDPVHGKGQYTEKRIYLSSRLPYWIQSMIPNIFYIEEKAWNYFPYTLTKYTCSFMPRFSVEIETRYEDNAGTSENCLGVNEEQLVDREVVNIDVAHDPVPEHKYKAEEDLTKFKSKKTGRGPLEENWKDISNPIMCSYKLVRVYFEVWGLQTKVEQWTHSSVRDVLLLGHRQAVAWIDDWIDMTMEDIRSYENKMHKETNQKVGIEAEPRATSGEPATPRNTPAATTPEEK